MSNAVHLVTTGPTIIVSILDRLCILNILSKWSEFDDFKSLLMLKYKYQTKMQLLHIKGSKLINNKHKAGLVCPKLHILGLQKDHFSLSMSWRNIKTGKVQVLSATTCICLQRSLMFCGSFSLPIFSFFSPTFLFLYELHILKCPYFDWLFT